MVSFPFSTPSPSTAPAASAARRIPAPSTSTPENLILLDYFPSIGYGTALNNLFNNSSPNKGVGVNITIPLRNRTAQADQARSQMELRQSEMRLQQLYTQIRIQVINARYALTNDRAQVAAAQASMTTPGRASSPSRRSTSSAPPPAPTFCSREETSPSPRTPSSPPPRPTPKIAPRCSNSWPPPSTATTSASPTPPPEPSPRRQPSPASPLPNPRPLPSPSPTRRPRRPTSNRQQGTSPHRTVCRRGSGSAVSVAALRLCVASRYANQSHRGQPTGCSTARRVSCLNHEAF